MNISPKVLAVALASSVSLSYAETLVWYHFDERPVGKRASYHGPITNAVNAAGEALFNGLVEVRTNEHAFGRSNGALPVYTNAFEKGAFLYDPVTKTVAENKTSLFFKTSKGNAVSENDGLPASAVWVEDYDKLTPSPEYTIEMFVRSASTPGVARTLLGSAAWRLQAKSTSGNLQFTGSGVKSTLSGDGVADGVWHHVAVVHKADKCMLYRDYQKAPNDSDIKSPTDYTGVTKLILGAPNYDDLGGWHGWIDEFRVSDVALEPEQFLQMTAVAGRTLFWAKFDMDMTTLPHPSIFPTGVVTRAGAELTWLQRPLSYAEGEDTVEKKNGGSLILNGGRVDFGRNLLLESERTVTVEFIACLSERPAGKALVTFADASGQVVWSVAAADVPPGGWHAVVLKVDAATSTQTLLVDGQTVSSTSVSVPTSFDGSSFVLGDADVVGSLDEVRVSRGLLADEELFHLIPAGFIFSVQ